MNNIALEWSFYRRWSAHFWVFIFFAVTFLYYLENRDIVQKWPLSNSSGGYYLRIPKKYLDNQSIFFGQVIGVEHDQNGLTKRKSQLLNVVFPSMGPFSDEMQRAYKKTRDDSMMILFLRSYAPDADDFSLVNMLYVPIEVEFGVNIEIQEGDKVLDKFSTTHSDELGLDYIDKAVGSPSGMRLLAGSSGNPFYNNIDGAHVLRNNDRDIYFSLDGNKIDTVIDCVNGMGGRKVPFPHCEQFFLIPDLEMLVSVRYKKELLPQWKLIQSKTKSLVISFKG